MPLPPSARRGLPPAEARRQVDGCRQKDSEPRGALAAAARSLFCWEHCPYQLAVSSGHVCTVTSACWMTAKVQFSEPLPEAYAKDSGNAAWRAEAGQIRRTHCLYVCSRVSLGARSCDSFWHCSISECMRKKLVSDLTQPFSSSNSRVFPPGAGRSPHSATR